MHYLSFFILSLVHAQKKSFKLITLICLSFYITVKQFILIHDTLLHNHETYLEKKNRLTFIDDIKFTVLDIDMRM